MLPYPMNMQKLIKERRMVYAAIDPDTLVEYIQPQREGYFRVPELIGIPEDAVCISCFHDPNVDLIMFKFYHKDFAKVEPNARIPIRSTETRLIEFMQEKPKISKVHELHGNRETDN